MSMNNKKSGTIGVLVKTYPKLSETFVLGELIRLERLGLPITVFALQRPTDSITHAMVDELKAPVNYDAVIEYGVWPRLARTHLGLLLERPARYLKTLLAAGRSGDIGGLKSFISAGAIAAQVGKSNIDHLHAHFASTPSDVAYWVNNLLGTPYSISAHAKDIYLSSPSALVKKFSKASFGVTCTAAGLGHLERIGVRNVSLVYHGVDTTGFSPSAPARTDDSTSPPLLLSIGRLRRKKGFDVLIEACRLLRRRGVDFRCEIVGYGPRQAELQSLIDRYDLTDRVLLRAPMPREEIIEQYRRASLFVLPCRVTSNGDRDGIPNVVLEAMSMALPLVSTTVSGLPEVIEDGHSGRLVEPDDPHALAQSIEALLQDPSTARRLADTARQVVTEEFCADNTILTLYDKLRAIEPSRDCCNSALKPRAPMLSLDSDLSSHPNPDLGEGIVGYILKGYPRLSEPFIANEIHLLETMGVELALFSIKQGDRGPSHAVVDKIRAPVSYVPVVSSVSKSTLIGWLWNNGAQFLPALGSLLKRRPVKVFAVLGQAVRMSWRYRNRSWLKPKKAIIKEFLQASDIAAKVLKHGRIAHLHGHFCHEATTVTMFVSELTNIPFSFTAHAKDLYERRLNPGDLLEHKFAQARFVATCTEANLDYIRRRVPDADNVYTIYHGLDVQAFRPVVRHGDAAGSPLIIAVGRFVEKKGFRYLIDACALLKRRNIDFQCLIVGERGDQYEPIVRQISEFEVGSMVTLQEPVSQEELRNLYARATVFALPCLVTDSGDRDGIPNVVAESMAMGLPVICSRVSGIPEIVSHRENGWLVEEKDAEQLADGLAALLLDAALRERLGRAARATICDVFDSSRTTHQLRALLVQQLRIHPPLSNVVAAQ